MSNLSESQHKKREFILRELVDTEAKFVRHMKEVHLVHTHMCTCTHFFFFFNPRSPFRSRRPGTH